MSIPNLDHLLPTALNQLCHAVRDVNPVALSGLAVDLALLSPADRAKAVQLFSWAARCPQGMAALSKACEARKAEILAQRGLVAV